MRRTIILAAAALVGLAACGDDSAKTTAATSTIPATTTTITLPTTTAAPATTTTTKSRYAIGEAATVGPWLVKAYSVKDPQPPGQFRKPDPGNRFVGVDLEVKNTGSKTEHFSSITQLEVQDSANHTYGAKLTPDIEPESPEGDIEAGGARRGVAVFDVPKVAAGLVLRVEADFFGGDVVMIDLGR